MYRFHLFEFEDKSWFPDVIRQGMTDYLQFIADKFDFAKPIMFVVEKGLQKSGTNQIVDICSGGGGPIAKVNHYLQASLGNDFTITLTDLYPNINAFKTLADNSNGTINYTTESIDATNVPPELVGLRTQFLSFHHFKPAQCVQILQNAVDSNAPIAIFEATERSIGNLFTVLFVPIIQLLVTPFIKPFRWSRLLFTYLIPLIPLCTLWDGSVSVLRSYTIDELRGLTKRVNNAEHYHWEVGKAYITGQQAITYMLGYAKN